MDTSIFTTAADLDRRGIPLPDTTIAHVGGLITALEQGFLHWIETNQIHELFQQLHHLMITVISSGTEIVLIDPANMFNPQLISSIAFGHGLHGQSILNKITLSRPFQSYQASSIINNLGTHLQGMDSQLIILTGLRMFFDPALANEDDRYPIPQLENLMWVIGRLRSLTQQGHTVLIISRSQLLKDDTIQPMSPKYAAKLHVRISNYPTYRIIELLTHPHKPNGSVIEAVTESKQRQQRRKIPERQRSLDDCF